MPGPRVLVLLDTASAWSRGTFLGFARAAHEKGWTILHFHPSVDLNWLTAEWPPDAAVLGPARAGPWPALLRHCVSVAVNVDRSAEGVASVCLDEARIADMAVEHFMARGFRTLTVFRFDDAPFAVLRDRYFREAAERAGARLAAGWWIDGGVPPRHEEHPKELMAWLASLPKPCGVFACCDAWARIVGRYARVGGLRIPEDIALVGVDNDAMECETMAPPLSSVALPWRSVGENVARLVQLGLRGKTIAGTRVLMPPVDVVVRRSSDTFALAEEPIVAAAVHWIREHAAERVSVPMVARAVGATRQRLERHFRRALGHTVLREIHRAHVEVARRLLATTDAPLAQIAKSSGFTNVALLSVAFRREVGVPPGAFRRSARGLFAPGDE